MPVQTITTPAGEELVVLSRREYQDLIDARDHASAMRDVAAGVMETLSEAEMDEYLATPTPLAFWRKRRGLTQARLAGMVEISQGFLAQIETGKRVGEVGLYIRLAKALSVRIDDVVMDSAERDSQPDKAHFSPSKPNDRDLPMTMSNSIPDARAVRTKALAIVRTQLRAKGYQVSSTIRGSACDFAVHTLGNQKIFYVKVHGFRRPNNWIIKAVRPDSDLYYVLTVVPSDAPARFFIMSQEDVVTETVRSRTRLGRTSDYPFQGFTFSVAEAYEDRWSKLPR